MKMHWGSLCACDFFSVEVLGIAGTARYMVFFVIEIRSRAVEIAGIHVDPDGEWMKQVARNPTDPVDGFLRGAKYLIHDRDPLFTEAFTAILGSRGVKSVKIPAKSPNCNPHAERFVRTIKYECLNTLFSSASGTCPTWSRSSWTTIGPSGFTRVSAGSSSRGSPFRPMTTGPQTRSSVALASVSCSTSTIGRPCERPRRVVGHYGVTRTCTRSHRPGPRPTRS